MNFYNHTIPREQLERERRERQSRNTYYTRDDRPPQALGKQRFLVCFYSVFLAPVNSQQNVTYRSAGMNQSRWPGGNVQVTTYNQSR